MTKSIAARRIAAGADAMARHAASVDVSIEADEFDSMDDELADNDPGSPTDWPQRFIVDRTDAGQRLDKALASWLPAVSRTRLQEWIASGHVLVNGARATNRHSVLASDTIIVTPVLSSRIEAVPEPMALDVVYQDNALIVINKPAGLVVHPGAGNWQGTLMNGLLAYDQGLAHVPRAGIVHRLDAFTTGLMVIARSEAVQLALTRQLAQREIIREYWAIVRGVPAASGTIDAALARDTKNRLRFRVSTSATARMARTHWRRIATSDVIPAGISWIACRLESGRTHQIRVHFESVGHPLIGDPLYRRGLPPRDPDGAPWQAFERQALHACHLSFVHPLSKAPCAWFLSPPEDLKCLMIACGFADADERHDIFEASARPRPA